MSIKARKTLDREDLQAMILGGCFFGSGGGGTLISARNLLSHFQTGAFYPSTTVNVVQVDDVKDGMGIVVAYLGAPAQIDSAEYPLGPALAVERIVKQMKAQGKELKYIVPPESGALGFLVACLVAAKYGLSVVDCDGAGRAVPSLPMLTFAAEGVSPSPAVLVSQGGLAVELDVDAPEGKGGAKHQEDVDTIVEHLMRPIVSEPEFGQFGGLAVWIMDPESTRRAVKVEGTLSRAVDLGKWIQGNGIVTGATLAKHLSVYGLQAFVLFEGSLQSGSLTTSGGFDVGRIDIGNTKRTCTCLYENETLIGWDSASDHPIAMAPDSIAFFVEEGDQRVASNGDLVNDDGSIKKEFQGKTVSVIGIAADASLRRADASQKGIVLRSFMDVLGDMGYHGGYVPVEDLHQKRKG